MVVRVGPTSRAAQIKQGHKACSVSERRRWVRLGKSGTTSRAPQLWLHSKLALLAKAACWQGARVFKGLSWDYPSVPSESREGRDESPWWGKGVQCHGSEEWSWWLELGYWACHGQKWAASYMTQVQAQGSLRAKEEEGPRKPCDTHFQAFPSSVCFASYTTLAGLSSFSWLSFPWSLGAWARQGQESDRPPAVSFAAHQDLLWKYLF